MTFASLIVSRSATSAHIFIYYVKIQPLIMPKLRHSGKTLYDSLGLFGYQPEAGSHLKIAPQDRTPRSESCTYPVTWHLPPVQSHCRSKPARNPAQFFAGLRPLCILCLFPALAIQRVLAVWWNGRHDGFKIRCFNGRAGSSPATATNKKRDLPCGMVAFFVFHPHRADPALARHTART